MAKLDPRKLMERAIEVMRQSVAEPRPNGKASPLVGVVLWKPDGTVEASCRSELRYGDHAEYTPAGAEEPPLQTRRLGALCDAGTLRPRVAPPSEARLRGADSARADP